MAVSSPIPFVHDLSGNNPMSAPFDQYNRTNDGDPTGTITPAFAGERLLDTVNGILYEALNPEANSWTQVTT